MNKKLKYMNYTVAFQEVPNEISLIINITGCPHNCKGCHSEYLREYTGNYIDDDISQLIEQYKEMITCVCFMGGDQNLENLNKLLCEVKKQYNLKTCVYSGRNNIHVFDEIVENDNLDYLKIGSFKEDLGGLDNPNTNQRFYQIYNGRLVDLTYMFMK